MRPRYWKTVGAIVRKDLLIELRTRESVPAMVLFSLATFVVFHFGLGRDTLSGGLAAGVWWVTLLLAAILGINRLFATELEQSRFDGILLTPIDRTALLLAKGTALVSYLFALEVVALPVFALFFLDVNVPDALPRLLAVLALANVGLAAIGCLVAGITIRARARELLTPLIVLPLMMPLVIAASSASEPLLSATQAGDHLGRWLLVLALFDTVFALLAFAVFDYLLED